MADFRVTRSRDAYFVIRGFGYQIDLTIQRWLLLADRQVLELERGEDIDIVTRAVRSTEEEELRQLEQIKHLDSNVTLRSPPVIEAISNAVEHRTANPELPIVFRFCTNAQIGLERPSPFHDRFPALRAWQQLSCDAVPGDQVAPRLAGIRTVLLAATKPDGLNSKSWQAFQSFLLSASDADLLSLVRAVEWSTGGPQSEEIRGRIREVLLSNRLARDTSDAGLLHQRLFLEVFKKLSQPGRKQLTRQDLIVAVTAPELAEPDRKLLGVLEDRVLGLELRVTDIEERLEVNNRVLAEVITAQQHGHDAGGQVASLQLAFSSEAPPLVIALSRRRKTVLEISDAFQQHTWLALRGDVGCGKTQLAILLAEAGDGRKVWVPLRDLDADSALFRLRSTLVQLAPGSAMKNIDALAQDASSAVGAGGILVLDDLPRLDGGNDLSNAVLYLARSCTTLGVTLLTTSHFQIPDAVSSRLPAETLLERVSPRFNAEEASELLAAHGASQGVTEIVTFLLAITEGHPAWLVAVAKYLSSRNWNVDEHALGALTRREHGQSVLDEAVDRLLRTVTDEDARRLLYRLCLSIGEFSERASIAVAAVPPAVERPKERLSQLNGLWIQVEGPERLVVSPLIKPLGTTETPIEVKGGVYVALGNSIATQREMTVTDVVKGMSYFMAGHDHDRAVVFLIRVLNSAGRASKEDLEWLLKIIPFDTLARSNAGLGNRLYLEGYRARAMKRVGINFGPVLDHADELIRQATDDDLWAVLSFTLLNIDILHRDLRRSLGYAKRIFRDYHKIRIRGVPMASDLSGKGVSGLIWMTVTELRSPDDLSLWLDAVELLPTHLRAATFDDKLAEFGCMHGFDKVWLKEHEKPLEQRNWTPVLDAFDRTAGVGLQLGVDLLWALAIRDQIIIRAEYLNDFDGAIEMARQAMASPLANPRSRYLIADITGRQFVYKRRVKEAAPWLELAVQAKTDAFPEWRYRTRILLSQSLDDEHRERALDLTMQAEGIVRSHPQETSDRDIAVVRGELALACWQNGDYSGAFGAIDSGAERLLVCRKESNDWKQLALRYGHLIAYFRHMLVEGQAPQTAWDGGPYATPYRGMFVAQNESLAEYVTPVREVSLFVLISGLAEAVGETRRAYTWALKGLERSREIGFISSVGILGHQILPTLLAENAYAEAVGVSLESAIAMRATRILHESDLPAIEAGQKADQILGDKSSDNWRAAERDALDQGVVPAICRLGSLILESSSVDKYAAELVGACRTAAVAAAVPDPWIVIADLMESIFLHRHQWKELRDRGNEAANSGMPPVQAVAYLGASLAEGIPIELAAKMQVLTMYYIKACLSEKSEMYARVVVPFLATYWRQAFGRERFRFHQPRLIEADLNSALTKPPEQRGREILRVIIRGLDVALPADAQAVRDWVSG
jgi:hypothetical protein